MYYGTMVLRYLLLRLVVATANRFARLNRVPEMTMLGDISGDSEMTDSDMTFNSSIPRIIN